MVSANVTRIVTASPHKMKTTEKTEPTINETTTLAIPPDFCDRYWSNQNYTNYRVFSAYEGLPECLILDTAVLLVIILAFSALRKRAWNYGRLGLFRHMEERDEHRGEYNVWTTMLFGDDLPSGSVNARRSVDRRLIQQDQGFFSWIPTIFRIKDADIYKRCGPDAVQYLVFQRYLIAYLLVVAVVSLTIALPLNFTQGDIQGSEQMFGRTTITNINPNSSMLWIHCALGLCLLCAAMIFMRHFTEHVHFYAVEKTPKSLMIRKIPTNKCFRSLLERHFDEAYPECEVTDMQFAFNVSLLVTLDMNRETATTALISSQNAEREMGERPRIMPYCCGALMCCKCCKACGMKEVDAIDYYSEQLAMYEELCDVEKVNAFHDPLGIVFVTFADEYMSERVKKDFRMTCKGRHPPMTSSVSRQLHVKNWVVEFAPLPNDIFWQNLSASSTVWWARTIAVNFGILLLVIFFTTPSVILNQMNRIEMFRDATGTQSPVILQFIPSLLLVTSSSLLPVFVSCSDVFLVGHFTRTSLNHTVMVKVFTFLLIMVLVMPSLGFSSIGTMIEWMSSGEHSTKFRWNCIFVAENCAFFVNYMMSMATIGIGLDLLRLSDLALYAFWWSVAKSEVERPILRKQITSEFSYGTYYAWILCSFTVTMAYSIVCPLITVPGLVYQVLKHYVDRHNLCFAYKSSKIDNRIHETAINFVIISVFCLQLTVLCFILLRADKVTGINVYAVVTLAVAFLLFCLRSCFGRMRPPKPAVPTEDYQTRPEFDFVEDSDSQLSQRDERERLSSFLPPVLENDYRYSREESRSGSRLTYGTGDRKSTNQAPRDSQRKLTSNNGDRESRKRETATDAGNTRQQSNSRKSSTERGGRRRDTTTDTDDTEQLITTTEDDNK